MKPIRVKNIKTGVILGILLGFGTSESGAKFAIVRPTSRALDLVIEVNESFNTNYEVKP